MKAVSNKPLSHPFLPTKARNITYTSVYALGLINSVNLTVVDTLVHSYSTFHTGGDDTQHKVKL
jgi:hypothetical protein